MRQALGEGSGGVDGGRLGRRGDAWFVVFVASSVLAHGLTLIQPGILGSVVDDALGGVTSTALVVFAGVFVGEVLVEALGALAAGRFGAARYYRSQVDIANQVMRLGIVGRMAQTPGMVATRRNEAETVAHTPVFFTNLAITTVGSVVAFVVLATYHWILAVAALVSVAALVVRMRVLMPKLQAGFDHLNNTNEEATSAYLDAGAGRRTIAACGLLDSEIARVARRVTARADADAAVRLRQGRASAWVSLLNFASQGTILMLGVWLLGNGELSGGSLAASLLYARMFYTSVFQNMNQGWLQIPWLRTLAAKHREFLTSPPALAEPEPAATAPSPPVKVELAGVRVSDDTREVLSGVDFGTASGSIALVGRSGVGKSTIGYLIGRLIDPTAGTVTLADVAVAHLARGDLASLVGYAFERPASLGTTIREFVALGRPLDDDQIWASLHAGAAQDFVERLPHGLDEVVDAAPFSGGEWQRLGIARAVAARPAVLVLDDPTSSLDSITEVVVKERLRAISEDRVVVVIAHRASMAEWADQVAWLRGGVIAAVGPHRELWADHDYRAAFGEDR